MASASVRKFLKSERLQVLRFQPGNESVLGRQLVGASAVLNIGVCGAVSGKLSAGDMVSPGRVRYRRFPEITIPAGGSATLLTVDAPLLDSPDFPDPEADIVDMEAYHVAVLCSRASVPFHCVKVVGDTPGSRPDPGAARRACLQVLPELTKSVEKAVEKLVNFS